MRAKMIAASLTVLPALVAGFGYMEPPEPPKRALLTVDVQDCFMEYSETLPVGDSLRILPVLNELRSPPISDFFDLFLRSQDWHPAGHLSFGPTHGVPGFYNYPFGIRVACSDASDDAWGCCPMLNATLYCADPDTACPQPSALSDPATNPVCAECFAGGDPYAADVNPSCKVIDQAMWPVHCTDPAEGGDGGFAEGLVPRDDDVIMQKGTLAALDAYSVFQDNAFFSLRGGVKAGYAFEMAALLESEGIEEFYVTGLATDFCVSWSAKDAAALGYTVYMIDDAAAGIANETTLAEYALMEAANVTILEYFGGPELEYRRRLAEAESVRRARELRDAGIARISMTDLRAKIDAEKTTTARRRLRG